MAIAVEIAWGKDHIHHLPAPPNDPATGELAVSKGTEQPQGVVDMVAGDDIPGPGPAEIRCGKQIVSRGKWADSQGSIREASVPVPQIATYLVRVMYPSDKVSAAVSVAVIGIRGSRFRNEGDAAN